MLFYRLVKYITEFTSERIMANETPKLDTLLESPLVYTLEQVKDRLSKEGFELTSDDYHSNEFCAALIDLAVQATGYQPTDKSETIIFHLSKKNKLDDIFAVYVNTLDEETWSFPKTPTEIEVEGETIPVTGVGARGRTSVRATYQETLQVMIDYDNRPRHEPIFRGRALCK